ncbi:MAG: ABC transporter ATP-binding protein [Dehalococcoidia bacterium]|jgi:branched-chain amino acid transport system ATP-binding protein
MLLKINNATVHYAKAMALDNVSLQIEDRTVVSLIGANGSGKSTILKAISGMVQLTSGEIWFKDRRIDGLPVHDIVKAGIIQIPEGRKLFPFLSVLTNLELGASLRKDKDGIKRDLDDVFEHFPILKERCKQMAGTLSGGQQQMLAIGRGLMAGPQLLLMDEPSLGLAPKLIMELAPVIQNINKRGIGVLLVEQNVPLATTVARRGYAIQVGRIVIEADISEFKNNEVLRKTYLG